MSSHITSDLEKVTDYIVFIHEGKVIFAKPKDELTEKYGIIKGGAVQFGALDKTEVISYRKQDYEWQVLISAFNRVWISDAKNDFTQGGFKSTLNFVKLMDSFYPGCLKLSVSLDLYFIGIYISISDNSLSLPKKRSS